MAKRAVVPSPSIDPDATQVWRIRRLPYRPTSFKYSDMRKAIRATIREREAKAAKEESTSG